MVHPSGRMEELVDKGPLTVLALGGNAILQRHQKGTFEEQYENVRATSAQLAQLIEAGFRVAIVHGNGPQIGATLIRHELGQSKVPAFPLHACGAETQGFLGYMIQQTLLEELARRGMKMSIATVVTQVLVEENDPAFKSPSKPIGPFYTKEEAENLMSERRDLVIQQDSGRGFRRFVASPDPKGVLEENAIRSLVNSGSVVIACGGGGIPVIKKGERILGVEAVIDKDLAAERLAASIYAETLIILTDVDGVYLKYGSPGQQLLSNIRLGQLEGYASQGYFARGSMGPKVEASIRFLRNGGKRAVIASLAEVANAMNGSAGTQITH